MYVDKQNTVVSGKAPRMSFLLFLYDAFVGKWLWLLFRHGPFALGFWKGLSDADICARIAHNSEAADWLTPSGTVTTACLNMIDREFRSTNAIVVVLLYAGCLVTCVSMFRQWLSMQAQARTISAAIHAAYNFQPPTPHVQLQLQTRPKCEPDMPTMLNVSQIRH